MQRGSDYMAGIPTFYSITFSFDFMYSHLKSEISQTNFISFGYDYYALARKVASQLNHQIILLLNRPLTHYWSSPLNTLK